MLFLSEIGLPKTRIGILLSFLPFSGFVALLIAPAVARAGVRRVFLVCWALRKAVTAFLLLTPWMVLHHGAEGAFLFVGALIALFALLRAVGETAWYPWSQELVPNATRGRFQGVSNIIALLTSSLALAGASWVLDHGEGLSRFTTLIGIGVVAGIICVVCALPLPGGNPGERHRTTAHTDAMWGALQDHRFRFYLAYTALTLVTMQSVFAAFVPLFMKEQVGLPGSHVVLLDVAAYFCGVLSSYGWGTWADRAGSRPLVPILLLMALLPLLWMEMPRHSEFSFAAALGVAGLAGV
ncbi:MAG: MFS transporter, partial [bacterium]|nr:MFS transporter [bacterium]